MRDIINERSSCWPKASVPSDGPPSGAAAAFMRLGDIGNRWPTQTTCADCAQMFRRFSDAVATRREDHRLRPRQW